MQPKRAEEFTGPWVEPQPREPIAARPADGAAEATPSPALLLREQLAQRLAMAGADTAVMEEPRLPMPVRIAVITGLALTCWAVVGLAVLRVL